jgi:hypothetical protein
MTIVDSNERQQEIKTMPTTIEKFVFEAPSFSAPNNAFDDEYEAPESTNVSEFQMNSDSKICHVKINNAGAPALYAIVDSDAPIVARRFSYFKTGEALPPNWAHIGTYCNGRATVHIGEVIIAE